MEAHLDPARAAARIAELEAENETLRMYREACAELESELKATQDRNRELLAEILGHDDGHE